MATFYQSFSQETLSPKLYVGYASKEKTSAFKKFKKTLMKSVFFHTYACIFLFFQAAIASYLLYTRTLNAYTPASIALLFLSVCCYILITYYQKNKKLDELDSIANSFFRNCSLALHSEVIQKEDQYLALSECLKDLAQSLQTQELFFISIPPFNFTKNHILLPFIYFHYNDIMYMQEKLLHLCMQEHKKVVESNACDIKFHSSLGKTYAAVAKIYNKPSGRMLENAFSWSNLSTKPYLQKQKQTYYTLAEEEAKIVCELSGDEAHSILELSNLYASFHETVKEKEQLEKLTKIIPDDKEILFKLGTIHFSLNETGKGLVIYNTLRKLDAVYAKSLLIHYGNI